MPTLRFNDGMTINTSGTYRVIRKSDGYYVVGNGMCCPVDSREEGKELIKEFTAIDQGSAASQTIEGKDNA
tara:strand:+ start:4914 stop:5126 length:213 start_codon:yes stop_codon:yes gene_type:complete